MSGPSDAPTPGTAIAGSYLLAEALPAPPDRALWRARRYGATVGGGRTSAAGDVLVRLVRCPSNGAALQVVDRAALASGERHPFVAPLLDCGLASDGCAYLVYDLRDGRTLRAALAEGRLSPALTLHIADQLLAALQSAHLRDTLHCGLGPDSVYLTPATPHPTAHLLDLGVADGATRSIYDDICALATLVGAMSDRPLPDPFGAMIHRALGPRATGWSSAAQLRAALRAAFG